MIIVDASVFVARFRAEPGSDDLGAPLAGTPHVVLSITLTELGMRIRRLTGSARLMEATVAVARISAREIVPVDAALAEAANDAFDRYGKGTGHPAALNFGDCLVYAAARSSGLPLLFKGDDFGHTDLKLHPACQDGSGNPLSHRS